MRGKGLKYFQIAEISVFIFWCPAEPFTDLEKFNQPSPHIDRKRDFTISCFN